MTCILGDFTEAEILQQLLDELKGDKIDLVISDMAPNLSGMKEIDQPKMVYLMELALDFVGSMLKRNGSFLVKGFQGDLFIGIWTKMKPSSASMNIRAHGEHRKYIVRLPFSSVPGISDPNRG
jgi:23S rRNA (uridine2552-2'-O)-methyltransferase